MMMAGKDSGEYDDNNVCNNDGDNNDGNTEDDNMDDWDEEKLMDVVSKKHGAEKTNQTEIVRVSVQNLFYLRFSKKL